MITLFRPLCPRQDSNLRTRLRRPLLYPLSYGGVSAAERLLAATGRTLPAPSGCSGTGFVGSGEATPSLVRRLLGLGVERVARSEGK